MDLKILKLLKCPNCNRMRLKYEDFDVNNGVVLCLDCKNIYPYENSILDFLNGDLVYKRDRLRFYTKFKLKFQKLKLAKINLFDNRTFLGDSDQKKQQIHSDWFAENDTKNYLDFEQSNFWKIVDDGVFNNWGKLIKASATILDFGCAQGRSTFKWADKDVFIIGFDVSKKLVLQANSRMRKLKPKAKVYFMLADANRPPFKSSIFDAVLVYGVLHHLPNPQKSCQEIVRLLKKDGHYFGNENNKTVFRSIFDLLQKIKPQWVEEAGSEPLTTKNKILSYFENRLNLDIKSTVFIPPHLINILPLKIGRFLFVKIERLLGLTPFIRDNGGLLIATGKKIK